MRRIPEPDELMGDADQAKAYAEADFSEPNHLFIDLFERMGPPQLSGRLLDLGCGPADIPLQLAGRHPRLFIDALDGAAAMLELARQRLNEQTDLTDRVRLLCDRLPCPDLAAHEYQFVLSNSLLHHLEDPSVLWQTVVDCAGPGAYVLVMDLARPGSTLAVDALVETHAIDAPQVLRRDFRNSLCAAYTPEEVVDQLRLTGLASLRVGSVSDHHLAVQGRLPL